MRDEIMRFNEDVQPLIYASAHFGIHKQGKKNCDKHLSFLAMADIHKDTERYNDAIYYLNEMGCFDFGINLGDAQANSYTDNDGTWFTGPILHLSQRYRNNFS